VDNITMGLVFEDLIRRFNEAANETAGDHFTPREVIRLMVNLLLEPDTQVLTQAGIIVTICDPACGTGGMLAEARTGCAPTTNTPRSRSTVRTTTRAPTPSPPPTC
jgi:type I restriction enzyme M protein